MMLLSPIFPLPRTDQLALQREFRCVAVCFWFDQVHLSIDVRFPLHVNVFSFFSPSALCRVPLSRFTVRDFQYNEEEMKADKEEMTRLSTDKKKQFVRFNKKLLESTIAY